MALNTLITITFILGLISLLYSNKYLLSLMLSLELMLLQLILYNIYTAVLYSNPNFIAFSIFIVAFSAIEASIGISLISLLSRKLNTTSIHTTNFLKH